MTASSLGAARARGYLPGVWDLLRGAQWWEFKLGPAMGIAYATAWLMGAPLELVWKRLLLLLVALASAMAYAYLVNDVADLESDLAGSQPNRVAGLSGWRVSALMAACVVPGLACAWHMRSVLVPLMVYCALWLVWTVYSVRPIRLKDRGIWGVIADGSGAHLLPSVLAVLLVAHRTGTSAPAHWLWAVGVWGLFAGARGILWHELKDVDRDRYAGVRTFAALHSARVVGALAKFVTFPIEIASFVTLLVLARNAVVWPAMALHAVLEVLRARVMGCPWVIVGPRPRGRLALHEFYEFFLPVSFLVAWCGASTWGWAALLAHLCVFQRRWRELCRHVWHLFRWQVVPFVDTAVGEETVGSSAPSAPSVPVPRPVGAAAADDRPQAPRERDTELALTGLTVVLAPPKTGSTAVVTAITGLPRPGAVYRVHTLHPELFHDRKLWYGCDGLSTVRETVLPAAEHHWKVAHLLDLKLAWRRAFGDDPVHGTERPTIVISVREPVSRYLSQVYYFVHYLNGFATPSWFTTDLVQSHLAMPDEYPVSFSLRSWWALDEWFDREVRDRLGLDVFAEPFDRGRGWQVYDRPIARFLVVRQESLAALPDALADCYGVAREEVVVRRTNVGDEHAYATLYRKARTNLRAPRDVLVQAYGTRYARHFYTDDELADLMQRWAKD